VENPEGSPGQVLKGVRRMEGVGEKGKGLYEWTSIGGEPESSLTDEFGRFMGGGGGQIRVEREGGVREWLNKGQVCGKP